MALIIRRRLMWLAVLTALLGLGACGTPTPYQPLTDGQGYAEQPIESDRYRVLFAGNSLTPRQTVDNYLLYRAAEITLAKGFDHFIVVEKDTERSTVYHATGTALGGYRGYGRHYDDFTGLGVFGSATSVPHSSYAAFANIVMRKGPKNPKEANAYDAREVLSRLEPRIMREPPS